MLANPKLNSLELSRSELIGSGSKQIEKKEQKKLNKANEKQATIDLMLKRSDIWQASQCQFSTSAGYRTGFTELDKQLPDGGWPKVGVCEVFSFGFGQGELCLVSPLLRQLIPSTLASSHNAPNDAVHCNARAQGDSFVLLIAPPLIPYAPTLEQQGIDSKKVLWLKTQERKEQLWALEQALSSGACPLVIAWLSHLSVTEARRLQLASEKGKSLAIFFLPTKQAHEAHPVLLKLSLATHKESANDAVSSLGLQRIALLKRRGAWAHSTVDIKLLPERLQASFHLLSQKNTADTRQDGAYKNGAHQSHFSGVHASSPSFQHPPIGPVSCSG